MIVDLDPTTITCRPSRENANAVVKGASGKSPSGAVSVTRHIAT